MHAHRVRSSDSGAPLFAHPSPDAPGREEEDDEGEESKAAEHAVDHDALKGGQLAGFLPAYTFEKGD